MNATRFAFALATVLVVSLALAPTAAAHKTTYSDDGKVKIVWGFLHEPAVTWTKTGLDLVLSDNATGAPIAGAHESIAVTLVRGEEELPLTALAGQHGSPGRYTQVVTLTQPGLYSIRIDGTVNGSAVDVTIPGAHEIHGVEETFFPAVEDSPYASASFDPSALMAEINALKTRLATLEAEAQTQSTTPATLTPQPTAGGSDAPLGAVIVALGIVGAALVLRRKA